MDGMTPAATPAVTPAVSFDTGTPRMLARVDGPVGWMTFNNPARRNAVGADMWAAIPAILDRFAHDPAIRVIALTGASTGAGNQAFVSGADISEFEQRRSTPETIAAYDAVSARASEALKHVGKPTVAVIRGWCIGGGLALAIGCDLRFATEGSRFGVPAARLGLGYAMPGVKTLVDLVGPAYAKEIFYTARHFSAAEARAMGLLNRVVPEPEFDAVVQAQLATIAANAPLTLHALKRSVAELARGPDADTGAVAALVAGCFASADYQEGRRAFMEKRPPVFTGQ